MSDEDPPLESKRLSFRAWTLVLIEIIVASVISGSLTAITLFSFISDYINIPAVISVDIGRSLGVIIALTVGSLLVLHHIQDASVQRRMERKDREDPWTAGST